MDATIGLWIAINHVVNVYRQEHPDWLFVRHEDLAGNPMEGFEKIFDWLDVPMDKRIRRAIAQHSSADEPVEFDPASPRQIKRNSAGLVKKWKEMLSPQEIERIRNETCGVANEFYGEEDW